MSVSHILSVKGRAVTTARSGSTVESVVKLLTTNKIGAVVITDPNDRMLGIVSERDVVRELAAKGAAILSDSVDNIMTKAVRTCAEDDSEEELMSLMTAYRIRHVPVVSNGKLVGMISIGDVVKHRIENIEREAADMKAYIAGAA